MMVNGGGDMTSYMKQLNRGRISIATIALLLACLMALGFEHGSEAKAASGRVAIQPPNDDQALVPVGDKRRYVAYLNLRGMPVVFDTWKRKVRKIRGAPGCVPEDVGGGRVLLECQHPRDALVEQVVRPRTASARTGKSVPVPRYSRGVDFMEIGRYWMTTDFVLCAGGSCGDPTPGLKSWRTGRTEYPRDMPREGSLDPVLNLKRVQPGTGRIPFQPKLHFNALDGFAPPAICHNRRLVLTDYRGRIRLWRSDTDVSDLGKGGISSFECSPHLNIGSGRVTWVKRGTAYAVDVSTMRKSRFRVGLHGTILPVRDGVVIARVIGKRGKTLRYRMHLIQLR